MKASAAARAEIKDFEGLRLKAYRCQAGHWTIGYGSLLMPSGRRVRHGDTVSRAEAEALFDREVAEFENQLDRALAADGLTVTQNQYDALLSFVFNLDIARLTGSTLWKKLKAGDIKGAGAEFPRWVYAAGKPSKGLTRRREWESELFLT